MEDLDDSELLRRLLGGSEPAARVFVHRFGPAVMRTLRGFRQFPQADIEDLYQEVFRKAFDRDCAALSAWQGTGSLAAYMASIARRLAIDRHKAQQAEPGHEPLEDPDALVGDAADPESTAHVNEMRRMMRTAIQQVGPPHTALLDLVDLQGLSYAEAGARLGRTANHVGVQVHAARQKLKGLIERDFPALRHLLQDLD